MSNDYWRGNIADGSASRRDEGPASAPGFAGDANSAAHRAPEAPASFEAGANSYWRGTVSLDEWAADDSASAPEPQRSGSVSAQARQMYAAEALRQKDHVAAGLLAIFLGMFGVHKFYLGCNQAGFIMLAVSIIGGIFTLGLAAMVIEVIAIIEGVTYLTKSQTEFDRQYVLHQREWF